MHTWGPTRYEGAPLPVTAFLNADEEIGSPDSRRKLDELSRESERAFVLEPSAGARGNLKTARKGVGGFEVRIHGKASHAGLAPGEGASAIVEASHQIQRLFALNDPERGTMRSFLLANAHGRAVDLIRSDASRRRREENESAQTADAGYDIAREVWDLALASHVREAMAVLQDGERAAIELAYFGGLTYREVADRLDEAEGTVKSRIRSGLKKLRSELVKSGITVGTGSQ